MQSFHGESHELNFLIDKSLFNAVLKDERFMEWHTSTDTWQLRFSGSPGCGKTTLSSIVIDTLRAKEICCVAGIHLRQDVESNEPAFVEDLLQAVYEQFANNISNISSPDREEKGYQIQYDKYMAACIGHQRGPHRIKLIRLALHAIIPALPGRAFLIVDDIDSCSRPASLRVEEEISKLQHQGVKIMTTSRVPRIKDSWMSAQCDGQECSSKDRRPWIHVYWVCEGCMQYPDREERGMTVFCNACWLKQAECIECNNTTRFSKPFRHVDFNISSIPDREMIKFVWHAIQQEHGNMGLGVSQPIPEGHELASLPTSNLELRNFQPPKNMSEAAAGDITVRAQGNIALAHKRLELFHRARSTETFLAPHDRLPASIVEMFNAGLAGVEAQTPKERIVGLQAMAVVGRRISGVLFEDFRQLVHQCSQKEHDKELGTTGADEHGVSLTLEEVLHTAKGFVVCSSDRSRGPKLMAFHPDFHLYCGQNYRESIVLANNSLGTLPLNEISGSEM